MTTTRQSANLLTEGSIPGKMLRFAFPIFLGNLFQQFYNVADSLIVGNFIGPDALAAVSSSGSLIFLMVGFFNGISIGAGVVTARYFGARDKESLERSVHTTVAFGIASGICLMLIGLIIAPLLLQWMGTPSDVLPNSIAYFRVYFCGSLAFVLYNIFVGILQSVGDSKWPLIYLIISSVINVLLDLLFVTAFHWGTWSAALATIISQFVSAGLCLHKLITTKEEYRLTIRNIRFDMYMLKQIIRIGLPTGLQNSLISLANVVVQSNINVFGKLAVAGCGAYSKIEGFGFIPVTCFSMSLTTFISQNLGAKKFDRVKKGAFFGVTCSVILAELVGICIYLLAPHLIALFNNDPGVIQYGAAQAHTVTLFYFLLSYSHCMAAVFRGAGKSSVPMLVMLVCWCVIRVTYITTAVRFIPDITTVFWAYPLTWTLSTIVFTIYYFKSGWLKTAENKH